MATLTISLTSGVVTGNKSWTVSDADVQTLIDYMAAKYGPNPGRGGSPLTPSQALSAWINGFVRQTIGEVHRQKQEDAAKALNVPPLSFT